jgi:Na+/H+-dicarboxylate symporter
LVVIRVLKALATPLIFFAVLDGLLRTRVPRAKGLALLVISTANAVVAVAIGLGIAHLLHSGRGSFASALAGVDRSPGPAETAGGFRALASSVPESIVEPFQSNNVIAVVLLALLVGLALRRTQERGSEEEQRGVAVLAAGIHAALRACTRLLEWVIETLPFAVAGVIASLVGKDGLSVFTSLGAFLGTVLLGLILHAVVYYAIVLRLIGKVSPLRFWRGGADAVVTALSCGSSLATLPVTLRCLKEMRVSTSSARLAACVGTNLNHDGIILYEAAATIFVAQALGMHLSLGSQLGVAVAAVMAGIGIAGVPEAGLITMPLVFAAGGIPAAIAPIVVPLILPVDWLLGRFRAATNVVSDMTVATLLDRVAPDETEGGVADADSWPQPGGVHD